MRTSTDSIVPASSSRVSPEFIQPRPALHSPQASLPLKPRVVREIQCGVQIPVRCVPTRTGKDSLAKRQTVGNRATPCTRLRGRKPPTRYDNLTPRIGSFVVQEPAKGAKAHITDGAGKMVIPHHAFDRQIFDHDGAKALYQGGRQLMQAILPCVPSRLTQIFPKSCVFHTARST